MPDTQEALNKHWLTTVIIYIVDFKWYLPFYLP